MCSLIYQEVVSHYANGGSDAYSCLLDASMAFDMVHYGTLFKMLLNKNKPTCIVRLVIVFNSYLRQQSCALWNSDLTNSFSLHIHYLFIYYDLMNSDYGCHIQDIYMGVLSYADDITIVCPSMGGCS